MTKYRVEFELVERYTQEHIIEAESAEKAELIALRDYDKLAGQEQWKLYSQEPRGVTALGPFGGTK